MPNISYIARVALLAFLAGLTMASPPRSRRQAATLKPFTLEETVPSEFGQFGFSGTWISATEFTYIASGMSGISLYNVVSGETTTFLSEEIITTLGTSSPTLSPDTQYYLAATQIQQVYRHSTTAVYQLYNRDTGQFISIRNGERLQVCVFDGVGHGLAFVHENDVYYQPNGESSYTRLTFDGVPTVIYNGIPDWVYEEEVFGSGRALWFSTDGAYLAIASFDDTNVETYSYYVYGEPGEPESLYPTLLDLKYPKVGTTNPNVRLRVINLQEAIDSDDPTPLWIPLEYPDIVTEDHVLGAVQWLNANEIAAQWLNRRQNTSVLNVCTIGTWDCVAEVIKNEPNGWISPGIPNFINGGNTFVELTWQAQGPDFSNAWPHIVVNTRSGGTVTSVAMTSGSYTVESIVGHTSDLSKLYFCVFFLDIPTRQNHLNKSYDVVTWRSYKPIPAGFPLGFDQTRHSFYLRTAQDEPWIRHLYWTDGVTDSCVSCTLVLPDGGACTRASATASVNARYLTLTCIGHDEPALTVILDGETNEQILVWADNANLRERLTEYQPQRSFITTVTLEDGLEAPVRFILPTDLDLADTETKYPVILYVYSGPNTVAVLDSFSIGYHSYLTTSRNVIYMMMDGRGSGLKGQNNVFLLNNNLGSVEMHDHLIILSQLFERYSWIDADRVGMWGISYGGYATLLTMAFDDQNIIKCGISLNPVTSWLYYDTIYTERYMGLPTALDNEAGYDNGDVTLQAEKLRGKDFLLVAANADDNVHYQNSMMLAKALQHADIAFEHMSYPDEAHSLSGVTRHRYNLMDQYWNRCLGLD